MYIYIKIQPGTDFVPILLWRKNAHKRYKDWKQTGTWNKKKTKIVVKIVLEIERFSPTYIVVGKLGAGFGMHKSRFRWITTSKRRKPGLPIQ